MVKTAFKSLAKTSPPLEAVGIKRGAAFPRHQEMLPCLLEATRQEISINKYTANPMEEKNASEPVAELSKSTIALMSSPLSDVEAVRAAAQELGKILGDRIYAIVGGAACALLGSPRTTTDIDIVVPRGETAEVRKLFRNREGFVIEKGTLHTYFQSNPRVDIEILTPPLLFREKFDESTSTVTVGSAKVLKPALLLNAKCHSILERGEEKMRSDAHDIKFLLKWCHDHGELPAAEECPRVTRELVGLYIQFFGGGVEWKNAGFDSDSWWKV